MDISHNGTGDKKRRHSGRRWRGVFLAGSAIRLPPLGVKRPSATSALSIPFTFAG